MLIYLRKLAGHGRSSGNTGTVQEVYEGKSTLDTRKEEVPLAHFLLSTKKTSKTYLSWRFLQ
jgi:hypothetical protein